MCPVETVRILVVPSNVMFASPVNGVLELPVIVTTLLLVLPAAIETAASAPSEPDVPEEPEEPDEPLVPDEPELPEEPEEPDVPAAP